MGCLRLLFLALVIVQMKADFEFESDPDEVMIAQESRHYHTVVQPPIRIMKPSGVTNSHRPQYNLDSFEDYFEASTQRSLVKNYKSSNRIRSKDGMVKDAVLKALERKDHVGKFAQILPIVRAMSGSQREALVSLVASQVSTPPGRAPLNLVQVRSMFGNNVNASAELMLPILLDMANMIRRAVRSEKEAREDRQPQILRRSFTEDEDSNTDDDDTITEPTTKATRVRNRRIIPQRTVPPNTNTPLLPDNRTDTNVTSQVDTDDNSNTVNVDRNITTPSSSSTVEVTSTSSSVTSSRVRSNVSRSLSDNATLDLMADSTNQTLAQDLPVAEKLRLNLNRYIDRNGVPIRRGTYPPKPSSVRRTTAEPASIRRRPPPARKLPVASADKAKCELFTNSLCLNADDYPTEAIVQSIRRNKAAAGALLADFRDPEEGAVDGLSAAQEEQYTADHYLVSNRRGDTLNRDFAGAGEAGFMCPSTVKYARPQRARATSGQWKYIVNTGEHTQTLRLEKCLKPKEACTYLTDNFKSKCVQVYNYHRLLTWDQQNGLHMDIFKVPTCCSCHIEGYSVSFPPLGHRVHETSSEHFPGEDISAEQGNNAFEAVQSTVQRPSVSKSPPFTHIKPLDSFPPFSENHNQITGTPFNVAKFNDNEETILASNTPDSFGNNYFPDSFNQASSIRNVKRPPLGRNPVGNSFDSVTLPSYLEPPTPDASSSFNFIKDLPSKIQNTNPFKRGAVRPNRRPIRKKITAGPDDLVSSGTSVLESFTGSMESQEDFNEFLEEPDIGQAASPPKTRITIAPKLHAASTEKVTTTPEPKERNRMNHSYISNGKRINYNYHPIIDFFGEDDKEVDEGIDREDSELSYVPTVESEWKPIKNPPNINGNGNVLDRKKHK